MPSPAATRSRPAGSRRRVLLRVPGVLVLLALACCGCERGASLLPAGRAARRPTAGPLVIASPEARYFTEARGGRAVLLTGSHTWNTLQDWGVTDPPPRFDYARYLDFLESHGHDFIRLYSWEQAAWFPGMATRVCISPMPYLRTGPGRALDGGLRFDVTRFNPEYFRRLRERVRAAGARGIYVSVMLFDGWSIELKGEHVGNPWRGHPFHRDNNVNGIDGDANGDGEGGEVHTLVNPAVTALQRAYLAKVVDAVGDLDNVLYEVSNESRPDAAPWQYEMIRSVRSLEAARGASHPVGLTAAWPDDSTGNAPLFHGPADWVSPNDQPGEHYKQDPPPSTSREKIVLSDTDHLWGIGGSPAWVWKSFFRGLNPIFMDPYETRIHHNLPAWPPPGPFHRPPPTSPAPRWEALRVAMGYAHAVAERVDLASLRPLGTLATSGYCLAAPGQEYVAWLPAKPAGRVRSFLRNVLRLGDHEAVTLDLSAARGVMNVEWVDPTHGLVLPGGSVRGGGPLVLRAPFAGDAIVHVRCAGPAARAAGTLVRERHVRTGARS
jgi:hypothetical protein